MMTIKDIPTPAYVVFEQKLRRNIEIISAVAQQADVTIIMALKANALWRTFSVVREQCQGFTASSLNELRIGCEYLCEEAHAYAPVYTDATIGEYVARSKFLTFNSLSQWARFAPFIRKNQAGHSAPSCGLRVNPQCSVVQTDIYNPCLPGSRFGVSAEAIGNALPDGIEGLHFHCLCESDSHDLEAVLNAFERQFGHLLPQVKWVNMGGGHLITREDYDIDHLIDILRRFHRQYPHLQIFLEPGSAFTWRTGDLLTSVLDIVENDGVKTAIIDASFACHMPDTLEMPYKPSISQSFGLDPNYDLPTYRIGGNSCLSGDYKGDWSFKAPLKAGDLLTFEDMNHYTNVKTTMFNGIAHPDIWLVDLSGEAHCLRHYSYEDYKSRMC